jgi:choline kinase
MQAVIMAAGKGRRLGSSSQQMPKCLLKIGNKSIVEHQLDILQRYGICDIVIVVGYHAKVIKDRLKDRGITFVFNPFYENTNVLTSFWFAQEKLKDDFVFLHGDTIFEPAILDGILNTEGDVVLPIDFKECEEEDMKVTIEGSQILKITKEMLPQDGVGEFIGVAKVRKEVLKDLMEVVDDFMAKGEFNLFFEAAIQRLIDSHKYSITFTDIKNYFWNEIDFAEDLEKARNDICSTMEFESYS